MKITNSSLIRSTGLSAMVAGILFIIVQLLHPPTVLSSVTTSIWALVHYLTFAMCILAQLGLTGLYARQAEKAGWLGLVGYLLFSLLWVVTAAEVFAEAFILPFLATEAPNYVTGLLGMVEGTASEVNLGFLPLVWTLSGLFYMLGSLLFGIATLRAGIFPRWAAITLVIAAPVGIVVSLLPHQFERMAAFPVGIGLAWLGYALLSEKR
jgi:hypothetical protein